MKSDTFQMSMLFDFYGELLTEKQKQLFDLYYNDDLSLTEIAENSGITRQGARDAIMRGEAVLRETEDKIGLVRRYAGIQTDINAISAAATMVSMANSQGPRNYEIAKQADIILQITKKISE